MFKKKAIKKDNLITKEDLGLGSPKAAPVEEEKKEEEVRGILEESKKIKKRSLKGVEANPKRIASPPEEKNQKEMTGLLDKGFLRQTGQVDIMDKNLEKHLNENQLSDTYGGKFTRTKQPLPQTSILKSLEPELGHIFKINELTKTLVDNAKEQTQWVSGMMEVQVGVDRKIKNIEASEAAKTGKQIVEEAPVPRRKDPKTKGQDKEYKKQMKDFEKAFRKEGRKFVKDQMMRKMESSAHEASQLED